MEPSCSGDSYDHLIFLAKDKGSEFELSKTSVARAAALAKRYGRYSP
jgi:hypothetical protein